MLELGAEDLGKWGIGKALIDIFERDFHNLWGN